MDPSTQIEYSACASLVTLGVRFQRLQIWAVVQEHVIIRQSHVGPLVHNQGGQQVCRYARHVPAIAEQRVYMKCMTQRKEVNAYEPKD